MNNFKNKSLKSGRFYFSDYRKLKPEDSSEKGFSIIELLVVITIIAIMAGVAYMSFSTPRKYAADDQALKMLDILQEARQKALTQRRVIRVEINDSKKQIRLINEYETKETKTSMVKDSDDDKEIRSIPFDVNNLVIGNKPANVTTVVPTQTTSIPELSYATTTYPLSNSNSVFTLCFIKDGRVLSPGVNGLCEPEKDDLGGATVYVSEIPVGGKSKIIRALTVSGISGAADVVKCQLDGSSNCIKWVK